MLPRFVSMLLLIAAVLGLDNSVTFVSPGPSAAEEDYSLNTIHRIGSTFHVAWDGTDSSRAVSIVLWQSNGTDVVEDDKWEYVRRRYKTLSSLRSSAFLFVFFHDATLCHVALRPTC